MKRKWVILWVAAIILIGSSISFWLRPWRSFHSKCHLCIQGSYFEEVPITLSSANIPYIDVEVEDKKITAAVDLGSARMIAFPRNFLEELNQKTFLKQVSFWGVRGKTYLSDLYKIPKIQIGGMSIFPVMAEEVNPEFIKDLILSDTTQESLDQGVARIGWELFSLFNVFLDFENEKIAFCDSLDTLRKHGYPVDSFAETPLLLDRNFIKFEVKTRKGKMRCILDTGCTLNLLNKDLENGSNEHMIFKLDNVDQPEVLNPDNSDLSVFDFKKSYETSVFKIGKRDFGKTTFIKIKMPFEIDAFVGMEFLRSKLVFIDFPNRKIYFYEK